MIALEDVEDALEFIQEGKTGLAVSLLSKIIACEKESKYDKGCQSLASELLEEDLTDADVCDDLEPVTKDEIKES